MKTILHLFLIFFLLVPLASCTKEQNNGKKPMAEKVEPVKVQQDTKATEEVKKVEQEEYKYDSKGKRDPFLSLVEITKQKPTKKKGASPIESFEIDEIQLMAIAWNNDNKYYALIRLPDGKAYTITEGMTLGLQGGKVQKITKDLVVIREYTKSYKGEVKPRDSILKLHKGE